MAVESRSDIRSLSPAGTPSGATPQAENRMYWKPGRPVHLEAPEASSHSWEPAMIFNVRQRTSRTAASLDEEAPMLDKPVTRRSFSRRRFFGGLGAGALIAHPLLRAHRGQAATQPNVLIFWKAS